jgi:NADH dehydrogenase FAD-containing subunit
MSLSFTAVFFDRNKRAQFSKFLEQSDDEDLLRFKLLTAICEYKSKGTDQARYAVIGDILALMDKLFNTTSRNNCTPSDCPLHLFDRMADLIEQNLKITAFPSFVDQFGFSKILNEIDGLDMEDSVSTISSNSPDSTVAEVYVEQQADKVEDHAHAIKEQISKGQLKDALTGREIVTWFASYLNTDRQHALEMARHVQQRKNLFVCGKRSERLIADDDKTTFKLNKRNKTVLIVGGGFAGIVAARKLEEHFQVTLIDMKPEFECIPSFPLLFGNPGHYQNIKYKYEDFLKHSRIKQDEVTSISPEYVKTRGGGKITYDYLIISTGARRAVRFESKPNTIIIHPYESRSIIDVHPILKTATNVVVVGGGPMAIETCCELCINFPSMKVKLISRSFLLSNFNQSVSKSVTEKLKQLKNLDIVLWHRVTLVEPKRVMYCDDFGVCSTCPADIVVNCTGMVANTEALETHMPYALDIVRAVVVNSHFQVQGPKPSEHFKNILAIGDCTNIMEVKLANLAMHHGARVAKVIHAIENGSKLPRYKTVIEPLTIAVGNGKAILVLNGRAVACSKFILQLKQRLEAKVRALITPKQWSFF